MILIQKGSFFMGLGSTCNCDVTHEVILTYDYYIGKYEITFEEYDEYCEDTGKSKPDDEGWGRGQHPVINVRWWDAIKYCNWMSEKERLAKAYDDEGNLLDKYGNETTDIIEVKGFRLPTEAEWEFAAKGGKESKGYKYAGSNVLNEIAWYYNNSKGHSHEVGKKKSNELGLFDINGNIYELCQDSYDKSFYKLSPLINPYNYKNESKKVARGGSWITKEDKHRLAERNFFDCRWSYHFIGFRVCKTAN